MLQSDQGRTVCQDEVREHDGHKISVVQVDEPALREAMPLRAVAKKEYLDWAVDDFLASAKARGVTQIHTYMCYCKFDDCMEAIDMDTDAND